jgi:hypothetical protein
MIKQEITFRVYCDFCNYPFKEHAFTIYDAEKKAILNNWLCIDNGQVKSLWKWKCNFCQSKEKFVEVLAEHV